MLVVAVVVAPVRAPGVEVQAASVVLVVLEERRRPIVAVGAHVVELTIPAEARSGEEDGAAIRPDELTTFHTVLRHPFRSGVVQDLLNLIEGWSRGHLSEGVVTTVSLWSGGTLVAATPQSARRQAKIYPMRVVRVGTGIRRLYKTNAIYLNQGHEIDAIWRINQLSDYFVVKNTVCIIMRISN